MTRDMEIAWAAGLFEGEGSISIPREETGFQSLRAGLGMTDFDVVARFQDVIRVGRCRPYREERPHWKALMQWTACGAEAVSAVVLMLPYLGERRTARAVECLAWFRDRHVAECVGCGARFVRANARGRYCTENCLYRSLRGYSARRSGLGDVRHGQRHLEYSEAIALIGRIGV